ncbi:trimeric intracellular cation channel family protein [Humisphaera borealis]|uniref:Trimeric intracellular cation channel family protein n=2 Tax=Humisphaera borealis TaxID=2807512 RepID=A0A7M2X3S5_9BACT|nr:trimeric intracellular cation channel family protein [Humisphaera borealis]
MSIFYFIGLLGVAVSAVSGALSAGRKQFDLIGVAVLALVTAIGGGTLRDILVDRRPIFWIADPTYIWVILAAAFATVLYARFRDPPWQMLLVADALMLSFFTISGVWAAEERDHHALIVVTMGTITGSAGGVIRDVLSGEVPLLFKPAEPLYATASIAGGTMYVGLVKLGVAASLAGGIGMGVVLAIRIASIRWGWKLPVFRLGAGSDGRR